MSDPTPHTNQIDITTMKGEIELIQYRQEKTDASIEKTAKLQSHTQKQLDEFIDVATKHFQESRLVHKLVYGVGGVLATSGLAYVLPKLFHAVANLLANN